MAFYLRWHFKARFWHHKNHTGRGLKTKLIFIFMTHFWDRLSDKFFNNITDETTRFVLENASLSLCQNCVESRWKEIIRVLKVLWWLSSVLFLALSRVSRENNNSTKASILFGLTCKWILYLHSHVADFRLKFWQRVGFFQVPSFLRANKEQQTSIFCT